MFPGALAVLVTHDHASKAAVPGVLTGKLPDLAGLLVCSVLASSLFGLAMQRVLQHCLLARLVEMNRAGEPGS